MATLTIHNIPDDLLKSWNAAQWSAASYSEDEEAVILVRIYNILP